MPLALILFMTMTAQSVAPPAGPEPPAIVPAPAKMTPAEGEFVVTSQTRVVAGAAEASEARKLVDALTPALGYRLAICAPGSSPGDQGTGGQAAIGTNRAVGSGHAPARDDSAISLRLDGSLADRLGDEGYLLDVSPESIAISAARPAGLFYGTQTLRQLLPPAIFRKAAVSGVNWSVPCVSIEDRPRFGWRGLLLDPARHFIPKSAVLDMIEAMALHKLNSLQLHLTDDQGWRIEIKKYPRLTEVGAWRKETLVGHRRDDPQQFDGRPHGGYYTQDDIREIVGYAADRYINVLPEIEMPGHARAAISAYPELGCSPDQQLEPLTYWGVCRDIFIPTEHTIAFLQDVLTEVLELFPSRFVHIGGDEAVKHQWKASQTVQARIKELGLKDENEMQSWFIRQMDTFLAERGRRLVGWDEILDGGLAPGATVMSWRGEAGGIAAAQAGHDVVMAPNSHTYLDYYQGLPENEPLAIGGLLLLKTVYAWEPIPAELTAEQGKRVLGGQGQLWSEYLSNPRHVQYMAFPRAAALAEVLWSPQEQRDYSNFLARLRKHLHRLDVMDVNYRGLDNVE
jgi:hexosaminidase